MPTPRATPQHRPTLAVRAVRSSNELEEIQRLRYQVCAQEDGQAHLGVAPEMRRLSTLRVGHQRGYPRPAPIAAFSF